MPYVLIKELKELMKMDFPSQLNTSVPELGDGRVPLAEPVLDKIDHVADVAHQLFGQRVQPNPQQARVLEENGFSIQARKTVGSTWLAAQIKTPRGLIVYR